VLETRLVHGEGGIKEISRHIMPNGQQSDVWRIYINSTKYSGNVCLIATYVMAFGWVFVSGVSNKASTC
jgi:hypothetical protein